MSQCQNGAPPMFLPWTNVTVTLDQEARNRGVAVSIGTPPQLVSLRPSTGDEDLYVVNKAACSPSYNDTCIGAYGGIFDPSASTSFQQVSEGQWNGTSQPNPGQLSIVYFNDVLTFGNATAYGFPASFDQPGYGGQGVLPLGWNSDFLKTAFSLGAVPSKAFAFWTGSRSVDNPVDGSLVIGGYDATRYVGEPTTFPSNENCPFCVVVTSLSYDTDQSSVSLFSNSSETLQVGLNPSERVLYVTPDMFEKFTVATSGVWDENLGLLRYPADNPPTGNLTVTLSNGYSSTIPSDELFNYPRLYNDQGQYEISNNTILIADVLNITSSIYVHDWGIPYLTMNYILADYARNQFQMAPAIRTNFQSQGGGYQLEAICDPALPASTTSPSVPSASGHNNTTPTPTPIHHGGSSNTGAIVGGVVGGVLGLILILGILGLLFYRSRRRRRSLPTAEAVETTAPPPHDEKYLRGGFAGERASVYTATSPTDVGELSSERKGPTASVNQWLSSQASEITTSAKMDRPFEMPAGRYDSD